MRAVLAVLLILAPAFGATKLVVTIIDQKTGKPVSGLKAADFAVRGGGAARTVESAEAVSEPVDVMLLLDTSLLGGMVQPAAAELIAQLGDKEQMAVVSFASSADLVQDFTGSKQLLRRAVGQVKFGNSPRVLDALFAALDGGFENASMRRVILLLTAGVDGDSRVNEREVVRLARRNGVSIYPVFVMAYGRSLLESLARDTGGATFQLREMSKSKEPIGPQIFEVLRSHYRLTVGGGELNDPVRVEVKSAAGEKRAASALVLE
ncbi:MAG: VWA domain-containing protein [Bryobacteraceae bacterium]|nr:VWA domain-containing protein [Bryobacteraceae bacterium]